MKRRPKVSKPAKVVVIVSTFALAAVFVALAIPPLGPAATAPPAPSPDPRSANPSDRFCVQNPDLTKLAARDEVQLRALADHFTYCEPDPKLAGAARRQIYDHMIGRGMPGGAYALAYFHLHGAPDRAKSIAYAQKAIAMGEPRGQAIIEEWQSK